MKKIEKKGLAAILVLLVFQIGIAQGSLTLENGTVVNYRIVTSDVIRPWEVLWGPDEMLWVTERGGVELARISRIDPVSGAKEVLYIAPDGLIADVGTAGLLGMAFHPNFNPSDPLSDPENGTDKLFITYTAGDFTQHLAVMSFDGNALSEPTTLVATTLAPSNHGSRLIISNDEKLLWTTGSDASNGGGQGLDNLIGKVLRVNLDGSIPSDNPFVGVADARDEIYSYGHRNAQGIIQVPSADPDYPNFIYSPEHGSTENDELNLISAGNNYGWVVLDGNNQIIYQGYCEDSDPETNECPLATFDLAPTGLLWYDHPAIPEWRRTLLMGTSKGQKLVRFRLDNAGNVVNKDANGDPAKNLLLDDDSYDLDFNGGVLARPRALTASTDGKVYGANLHFSFDDGAQDYIFVIENESYDGCPEDSGDECEVFTITSASEIEICDAQSFTISLPASVRGASYELLQNGNPTGIALDGTGCSMTFTITPNVLIQNGLNLSDGDRFEIQATGSSCSETMEGSVTVRLNNVFSPRFFEENGTYTAASYEEVTYQWYDDNGIIAGANNATYTGANNPRVVVSSCTCDAWASNATSSEENIFGYEVNGQFLFARKLGQNLDVPWSINFEQDDNLWVTERDLGQVLLIDPVSGNQQALLTLGAAEGFENTSRAGLMGLDVNWSTTPPEAYISYTYNDGGVKLRIAKYEYNASSTQLQNPTVLVEDIPQTTNYGSDVLYDDGFIYVSTGSTSSQDDSNGAHRLDNLIGKILRVNVANPQTSIGDLIYSYGHRNPQGITITPDNKLYSAEHGEAGAVDEVNLILEDTNYGWPFHEGECSSSTSDNECPELLFGTAPGGIAYYPESGNITGLRNTLLMANLKGQNVSVIDLDGSYNVTSSDLSPFGRSECGPQGRVRDVAVDVFGNVYLLTNGDNAGVIKVSLNLTDIEEEDPLGISTELESLKVFPNPVTDFLSIKMDREDVLKQFRIYDLLGNRIPFNSRQENGQLTVDVRDLSAGLYIIKYSNGEKQGKFFKR